MNGIKYPLYSSDYMITSIRYKNFKALADFTVYLKHFNVLTGPNNNGKSTILDGLRVLQAALRYASRKNPKFMDNPFGQSMYGFEIPESSIPIILENIQSDLNTDEPAVISFRLSGDKKLHLYFHFEHPVFLFFETPNKNPLTSNAFRAEFPVSIAIVPTLGPFETSEDLHDPDYVKRWYGSRRSPRMFRSFWYYNQEHFEEFREQVEKTWPGMSVSLPEKRSPLQRGLVMFCAENRMPREICWAGFGFQIWLQLLSHIIHARGANLIVIDEPEIYLHPDLQHKILDLLKGTGTSVMLATHSVEIINAVDSGEVLLIDKKKRHSKRISDLEGLQSLASLLGSSQNTQLARLSRSKKILFTSFSDLKLLRKLAAVCREKDLFSGTDMSIIPVAGFHEHSAILFAARAFAGMLEEFPKLAVLMSCACIPSEETETALQELQAGTALVHFSELSFAENACIVPEAIARAIQAQAQGNTGLPDALQLTEEILGQLKEEACARALAAGAGLHQVSGAAAAASVGAALAAFGRNWENAQYRRSTADGRRFFAILSRRLSEEHGISLSVYQVAACLEYHEVNHDLRSFFTALGQLKRQ